MKSSSKIKNMLFAGFAVWLSIMLIRYSPAVARSVQISSEICLNIIIPSLFAFTAVSMMIVKSNAIRYISLPLHPLSKYLFHMPDELFSVFIISCIAGYPVGIKLLSEILDNGRIDKRTAENMSVVCFCGGPAFYSGSIGLAVFGSTKTGMLIFASVAGANLISAIIIGHLTKPEIHSSKGADSFDTADLCSCITLAGRTMISICTMIVFFSSLIAILEECGIICSISELFGLTLNGSTAIKGLLEISCITKLRDHPYELLPEICAICSFGGLCIIAQLYSIKSKDLSMKKFLLSRPLVCALSAIICITLRPYFMNEAVSDTFNNIKLCNINNFVPSLCLILMIFLLNLKKTLVFSK